MLLATCSETGFAFVWDPRLPLFSFEQKEGCHEGHITMPVGTSGCVQVFTFWIHCLSTDGGKMCCGR